MSDILIKNMELPKQMESPITITIFKNGGVWMNDVTLGKGKLPNVKAIELPPYGSRCVEVNAVVSAITKCFADCKAKGIKPTPFIISVYIGKVPTILEASE